MKEKVSVPFMLLGILFNVCLIAANLLETKVIQVGSLTVTAGLLVFPISYIINDCIAEVWPAHNRDGCTFTGSVYSEECKQLAALDTETQVLHCFYIAK